MYIFKSLPNNKIPELSNLNAVAGNRINDWRSKICSGKCRKQYGKWRKCWLAAFSPCSTMFSKGFVCRVDESWDCVVNPFPHNDTV